MRRAQGQRLAEYLRGKWWRKFERFATDLMFFWVLHDWERKERLTGALACDYCYRGCKENFDISPQGHGPCVLEI